MVYSFFVFVSDFERKGDYQLDQDYQLNYLTP